MAKKVLLRVAFALGIALLSWVIHPQNILPTLISLALLVKVCVDLIRHRASRLGLILGLALVFAMIGVIHDATVPTYASARCRDGWYSYSGHRSGTCSWHDGVAQWHPRVQAWWERFRE
jgi:hypothetical protein